MGAEMGPNPEEMYSQHKEDAENVKDLKNIQDNKLEGESDYGERYDLNLSEGVRKHMGAAVESANKELKENVQAAKAVKDQNLDEFINQAKGDMNAEMAERTERNISDEEIFAKVQELLPKISPDIALEYIHNPREFKKYYPGYGDADMVKLGEELDRLYEEGV